MVAEDGGLGLTERLCRGLYPRYRTARYHQGWHLQVGGNGGGVPEPGLLEYIPSEEAALVIVERLIAWFVARNRCCRLGKIVDEVGWDKVRRVALGEGVERS